MLIFRIYHLLSFSYKIFIMRKYLLFLDKRLKIKLFLIHLTHSIAKRTNSINKEKVFKIINSKNNKLKFATTAPFSFKGVSSGVRVCVCMTGFMLNWNLFMCFVCNKKVSSSCWKNVFINDFKNLLFYMGKTEVNVIFNV